ncbi:MAG: hypothetical protein HC815_27980 [Richelia sp. RM1_1_1]|nr:hypothetical protein [Richelia sp. RM1_1_1]
MQNLTQLLEVENSELAKLLRFSLYGVEGALKKALTELPNDPGAELCQKALLELNGLLQTEVNVTNITHKPVTSANQDLNLASKDMTLLPLSTSQSMPKSELKLIRLREEFNRDNRLIPYLGNFKLQSQTDSELWNEIQRKLLRVPEELALFWRQKALKLAAEIGAREDKSNCLPLPSDKNENIYSGLTGSVQVQGLCFSTQVLLHSRIGKDNFRGEFREDLYFLAYLISACIKFIDIDPDLHHALRTVFSHDAVNLSSQVEQRDRYIDALIDNFLRTQKAEENADALSALRHWIDLDEAINSLIFVPPADNFSWWGKQQREVRRILKKVVQRAQSQGHNIRVRPLSGVYADICALSKHDLRLHCGGNPGEVLACLRVYAKINDQEYPGRVLFRSSS